MSDEYITFCCSHYTFYHDLDLHRERKVYDHSFPGHKIFLKVVNKIT